MIVVSDTTPLITLMKIDKLELLEKLFGEVFIPRAVFRELTANEKFADEARKIESAAFFKVREIADKKSLDLVHKISGLDLGESEAIVLAQELDSDLILIDEFRGRLIASQMNLHLTGTLGVLYNSYKRHFIERDEIENCIEKIRNSNIRISEKLLREFLENL